MMSLSLQKSLVEFTARIVSDNSSLPYDDIKDILSRKENTKKIKEFIIDNKIKQKKEKKELSDKPKRPETAYIKFSSDMRDEFIALYPTAESKEITSLIAKRWDEVKLNCPDTFEKYNNMAIQDKIVYEKEMKEYRIKHNIPEKIVKVKKPKVEKPEKARTPLYYYTKDRVVEIKTMFPSMKNNEINEKIRMEWKEFKAEKDETYKKYKQIAKEKKCEMFVLNNSSSIHPLPNSLNSSPVVVIQNSGLNSPDRSQNQPMSPDVNLSPVRKLDMLLSSPDNSPLVEFKKKVKKIKKNGGGEKKKKKLTKKKDEDDEDI